MEKLKQVYVVEYWDRSTGKWNVLYTTFARKVAIYQYNKAKRCLPDLHYRLYVTERIL